jgi:hypothetical protein
MPCCMPPERTEHRVYGVFPDGEPDPFLAKDMIASRLAFADRQSFVRHSAEHPESPEPYCAKCTADPDLTYTVRRDVRHDLAILDPKGVLSQQTIEHLTDWPGSRSPSSRIRGGGSGRRLRAFHPPHPGLDLLVDVRGSAFGVPELDLQSSRRQYTPAQSIGWIGSTMPCCERKSSTARRQPGTTW